MDGEHENEAPADMVVDGMEKKLPLILSIQSLLNQFCHSSVRADFVNGKFGPDVNPRLLPAIDELNWSLFPRWQGGSVEEVSFVIAAEKVGKLMNKNDGLLVLNNDSFGDSFSYAQWRNILESLALSDYWQTTTPADRCVHIIDDTREKNKIKPEATLTRNKVEPKNSANITLLSKRSKKSNKTIEEIVVDSSDESQCSSSSANKDDDDSTCYSSSEDDSDSPVRRSRRSRGRRDRSKEVIIPPKFKPDGNVSLTEFLKSFEKYFSSKYKGDNYDKCQLLGDFIEDELLEVFKMRGGRKLKYDSMKNHLLKFYKKEKYGGKDFWRKKIKATQPGEEEKLDLYGMRLLGMVELAYPKSKSESAKKLRNHFLETIPASISRKLKETERTMKATTRGKKKHLNFTALSQLARDIQKESSQKSVMWSSSSAENPKSKENTGLNNTKTFYKGNFKTSTPTNDAKVRQRSATPGRRCWHCQKTNHFRDECWRAKNACLICGDENHSIEECPKYNPNYKQDLN